MGTADGTIVGTTKVVDHGPNGDKWNLVVLGDGFRAADQADYTAAVTALVNTLKATAPFDGVWDRVNVHRVDVHSTDAGADDPAACADGSSPAGGTAVTAKTYFDSSFCNSGIRRLLVPDQALGVTTANAQVPGWDAILMIVNSTEFGGSGGTLATYSLAPAAIEIAIHEMGHAAFGLADEYEYFTGCASGEAGHNTHPNTEPTEPNITVETDRTKLKWRHLVDAATASPDDPERRLHECDPQANPVAADTVGLFEGAHYFHCGAFRPSYDCRMRTSRDGRSARLPGDDPQQAPPRLQAVLLRRDGGLCRCRPSRRRGAAKLARQTPRAKRARPSRDGCPDDGVRARRTAPRRPRARASRIARVLRLGFFAPLAGLVRRRAR